MTDDERKVLGFLSDQEEFGHAFDTIASDTGLGRKRVRSACRSLTDAGFAKFCQVLWDPDEPRVAGSGYMVTPDVRKLGPSRVRSRRSALDWPSLAGRRATVGPMQENGRERSKKVSPAALPKQVRPMSNNEFSFPGQPYEYDEPRRVPVTTDAERYRNALMWAFDRLSLDGGMTVKEQKHTMKEIGRVLQGQTSPASRYVPNDWDDSSKLSLNSKSG